MKRTLVVLAAIAASVVLVAAYTSATTFQGTVTSTTFVGAFTGALTGAVTGAVTGNLTGNVTGNVTGDVTGSAAGALGNFTVVEADTLKPGAGTGFYLRAKDGHNDATLNCATFAGALTGAVTGNVTGNVAGNVTGNTATLFQSVAYKGNLPAAASNTGEFFKNTVGDSGFVADNNSWVQLWP